MRSKLEHSFFRLRLLNVICFVFEFVCGKRFSSPYHLSLRVERVTFVIASPPTGGKQSPVFISNDVVRKRKLQIQIFRVLRSLHSLFSKNAAMMKIDFLQNETQAKSLFGNAEIRLPRRQTLKFKY